MRSEADPLSPAHELFELLRWFGKLRWVASGSLAVAAVVGPGFGIPRLWPSLFVVAFVVATYNYYFQRLLQRPGKEGQPFADQRLRAIAEISLDLAALLVAVHFTGGLRSPMLPFFVFHMAIGTMLLSNRTMYTIAATTCLGVFFLYLAELEGLLPHRAIDSSSGDTRACDLSMVTFVVTVFGTVYLTGRVSKQSRERNVKLFEATEELRSKTSDLERALHEIQELEIRKSHYMRISAHQLRSPLGTVKTSLKALSDGYMDVSAERGQHLLHGVEKRVDGLLEIVNDLLELAKIREGQANAPWTENVSINEILEETVEAMRPAAEKNEVQYVVDIADTAVLTWGVPPDLKFAFDNLVHNAIRYSHSGGQVRVELSVDDAKAKITVQDEGIGIPEDLQRDIFLEFVRAPNAKKHAPQGTGLGLAIVKEVTELHGGILSLRSREGEGATFTLEFPLMNAPPAEATKTRGGNRSAGEAEAGR